MSTQTTPTRDYSGRKLPTPDSTSDHVANFAVVHVYDSTGRLVAKGTARRHRGRCTGPFNVVACGRGERIEVPDGSPAALLPGHVWVVYLPEPDSSLPTDCMVIESEQ